MLYHHIRGEVFWINQLGLVDFSTDILSKTQTLYVPQGFSGADGNPRYSTRCDELRHKGIKVCASIVIVFVFHTFEEIDDCISTGCH